MPVTPFHPSLICFIITIAKHRDWTKKVYIIFCLFLTLKTQAQKQYIYIYAKTIKKYKNTLFLFAVVFCEACGLGLKKTYP